MSSPSSLRPTLKLLRLQKVPIFTQLQIEERLLRADKSNWFVINEGRSPPTIVLGISGKPEKLVHLDLAKRDRVRLLRRFTGGGTVIIDPGTIFTSFILNQDSLPDVQPYPRPIMNWTEKFYAPIFERLCGDTVAFSLQEHDYAFGEKKFGGNAQSITKDRIVHHTSMLWDFDSKMMRYLTIPEKQPEYRAKRTHDQFLCRLRDFLPGKEHFYAELQRELEKYFQVQTVTFQDVVHTSSQITGPQSVQGGFDRINSEETEIENSVTQAALLEHFFEKYSLPEKERKTKWVVL